MLRYRLCLQPDMGPRGHFQVPLENNVPQEEDSKNTKSSWYSDQNAHLVTKIKTVTFFTNHTEVWPDPPPAFLTAASSQINVKMSENY